jgi:cell division protein FtsB
LNIFDIKSRFPNNDPTDKRYLKAAIGSLLEKVIIFHDLYKERFGSFDKVKVIFFYDSVRKEGYDEILLSKIEEFINSNKFLVDKFEFQIIFIAKSFLDFGFKSLSDRIDRFFIIQNNIIINDLNKRVEKLSKENQELRDEIDLLKKDRNDKGELSQLKHEMKKLSIGQK